MIRREELGPDGKLVWLLIDQIEHARLAGSLAQQWQLDSALPAAARAEWVQAVFHHDDGWAEWDAHPGVDARNAQPLSFNEMPTADSTRIWRRSIAAGAALGPLAEYAIAGHFRALLVRFASWRQADAAAQHAGESFLQFADTRMAAAMAQWQSPADGRTADIAQRALHLLQFFDALSLWFCCERHTVAQQFSVPGLGGVTFSPVESAVASAEQPAVVAVEPWPFGAAELGLSVAAVMIPAEPLDCQHLDGTQGQRPRQLCWWLGPR